MNRWREIPRDTRTSKIARGFACIAGTAFVAILGVVTGWLIMSWALPNNAGAEERHILENVNDVPYKEIEEKNPPKAKTREVKKEKRKDDVKKHATTEVSISPEETPVQESDNSYEPPIVDEIEEVYEEPAEVQEPADIPEEPVEVEVQYTSDELMFNGEVYDGNGQRYTWYSQNVLPGGGLDIPGRHVDEEGYVVDGDGYVVLAYDEASQGEVMDIPFGSGVGKVYDVCDVEGTVDVYTDF